jgi:AmpE protein
MTLISLLIVLVLEFHFKIGSEYRDFSWFNKGRDYLTRIFSEQDFFDSWGGIAIILLTPVLLLYGLVSLFDGSLYWLVLFMVSVVVLFLCLGPQSLENSFKGYFESMQRDDFEAAFLHLEQQQDGSDKKDIPENDELVRSATRTLLVKSQKCYFGVIAWFIFLGPVGALFYRLSQLYRDHCAVQEFDEHLPLMNLIIHWIDWVPARLTSLMFLLTGDFVNGLYRIKDYLSDADADNNQLISETGIAALGLEMGVSDGDMEENHRAIAMVQRTVIIYVVVAAVMTTIS